MRIQHNIAALNSYRQLGGNNNALSKNLEKLSSGYRINRAGDDAAGLAISEKMRAQIKGLETAQKNANDGISLIQTAEGALTEVHSMLNRMTELATQSANGIYEDEVDRENLQAEVDSLLNEIDRIAKSTNFNGRNLLDGSLGAEVVETPVEVPEVDVPKQEVMSSTAASNAIAFGTRSDVTVSGYQSGALTAATASGTADLKVSYRDEQGQDQTLKVEGMTIGTTTTMKDVVKELNDNEEFNKLFTAKLDSTGANVIIESKVEGSKGMQNIGLTVDTADASFAIAAGNTGANSDGVTEGKDASQTITVTAANIKAGDTVTLGDKVFEFVSSEDKDVTTEGAIKVVIDAASDDNTAANLQDAMKKNGIESAEVTNNVITIKDLTEVEAAQKGTQITNADAAFSITSQEAAKGEYSVTLGAGTAGDQSFTVQYTDGNGERQTATVTYTGTATASTNIDAIMKKLEEHDDLKNAFDFELDAAGTKLTFKAKEAGSKGASVTGIVVSDTAAGMGNSDNEMAVTRDVTPVDAGKVLELQDKALTSGDKITIGGKTFEFVDDKNNNVAEGNIAVLIERTTAAGNPIDENKTMENLADALEAEGIKAENANGKITFLDGDVTEPETETETTGGGLTLQIGDTSDDFNKITVVVEDMGTENLGLKGLSVADQDSAAAAIDKIKDAINKVSSTRGDLGAIQNRLEHTINNLGVTTENITAAESRIRDTDMASEMMQYTKNNILIQASQAMLAQANQVPQGVLQLLQ